MRSASLPVATTFEPRHALDGGPDGLDVIRRLLAIAAEALAAGGVAMLEIGADQGDAIVAAVARPPGAGGARWSGISPACRGSPGCER